MTLVVFVCSPLTVATAKGSGKPGARDHTEGQHATYEKKCMEGQIKNETLTKDIALVEAICCDNCRDS